MAQMIPPSVAPETPSSERKVYERLQYCLPDTWTVIHSQRFLLPSKRGVWEGELDFLILDPQRGAIGLEVKGGRVQRSAEGWFSTDRNDERHGIKDPGRQVSSAVHAIRKYLEGAKGFGGSGYKCRYGLGVVLPDIETKGEMGADLPREIIIDKANLVDLRKAVERIFDFHQLNANLSASAADAFVKTLVERSPPASRFAPQFKLEAENLLRLTDSQIEILDVMAAHQRVAIEGSAGTGKTVLAMEKARRLASTGANVLLLCFNKLLAHHLGELVKEHAHPFTVETFHSFCQRMASQAHLPFEAPENNPQNFWEETTPMLLMEALEKCPELRYDAIIVDEAQDFLPDWWTCLDEALRQGKEDTLYAFYDGSQAIYKGNPAASLEVSATRLIGNCRNTRNIGEYAARFVGTPLKMKQGAPKGLAVEEQHCGDAADIVRKVTKRLVRLVDHEGIASENTVILANRTLKNSPFASEQRAGRFKLVSKDAKTSADQVVFETVHRFKGLEADVVIMLDLPDSGHFTQNHRYVAATRAKHLLVWIRLEETGKPAQT